ncbi:MAG TPA: methyltransferase domain-containing protein [Acetobacteraceae bacterium]|nr:methyltransferase domain-containing protein [Acetobacteraceae bacterium]
MADSGDSDHTGPLDVPAKDENFTEAGYLAANPDVASAVASGSLPDGRAHFQHYGRAEGRRLRRVDLIEPLRERKLERLLPLLDTTRPHTTRDRKFDFLTDELRAASGIVDTPHVSSNPYDPAVESLIRAAGDGLLLDCGAGRRPVYHANVVNLDIVDYDTTDVIAVGENLPFHDASFEAAISVAVLEHVRDPFACAAELVRVLKPGGRLLCCVPFLQPEHAYPHHYFNMSRMGLRRLFEDTLVIDDHQVPDWTLPVWSLTWMVQSWAAGLPEPDRSGFLSLRLGDLMVPAHNLLGRGWVKKLGVEKNFELASATMLLAHKAG